MSRENVEALKQAFAAATAAGTLDELLKILDEDIVWDPGEDFPSGKEYGHDGARAFFRQWIGTFDDWRFEVAEYRDCGNAVYVQMHQWGRGKGSGITTEIDLGRCGCSSRAKSSGSCRSPVARRPSKPRG